MENSTLSGGLWPPRDKFCFPPQDTTGTLHRRHLGSRPLCLVDALRINSAPGRPARLPFIVGYLTFIGYTVRAIL